MPTAAFVAGPEALFRAQPGPLLKNRVFRLEPLFFPSSSLGGPWEAPGRPLGGPGRLSRSPRDRLSRGPPGTGCPGALPGQVVLGRPGASRGFPGTNVPGPPRQDSCPGGPPGRPREPTQNRRFQFAFLIGTRADPGWGPLRLKCF